MWKRGNKTGGEEIASGHPYKHIPFSKRTFRMDALDLKQLFSKKKKKKSLKQSFSSISYLGGTPQGRHLEYQSLSLLCPLEAGCSQCCLWKKRKELRACLANKIIPQYSCSGILGILKMDERGSAVCFWNIRIVGILNFQIPWYGIIKHRKAKYLGQVWQLYI